MFAISLAFAFMTLWTPWQESPTVAPPRTLTTEFVCLTTVPIVPPETRRLRVWLPLPSDSELQRVESVQVESAFPHRITQERQYGNRMVYFEIDAPPAAFQATLRVTVKRTETRYRVGDTPQGERGASLERGKESLRRYLKPDKKAPMDERVRGIAQETMGAEKRPLEKMRRLFQRIVATMQYDYKQESPRLGQGDVPFVCDYKKGNCSDLHSYLIALARSLGIPAALEYGFPVTGVPLANPLPQEGAIRGYHCWTWFKIPEVGWLPLDASDARRWLDAGRADVSERLFGNLILERSAVAFSRGRDVTLAPPQKASALNYFIAPYCEADGRPLPAQWTVHYRLRN